VMVDPSQRKTRTNVKQSSTRQKRQQRIDRTAR
jgi:hypothetical protein